MAVCAMFLLVALALCWFVIASNYSDAAASGTYKLSHEGLSSNLNLRPDHTFTQEVRDSRGVRSTQGTWRRFGIAANLASSSRRCPLPRQGRTTSLDVLDVDS
jgi:hypothetical protein